MRRFKVPLIAISLPIVAFLAIGQQAETPPSTKVAALSDLKSEAPNVRFFEVNNRVSRVYGVPFADGESPSDTASTFVTRYAALFEPGDGSFEMNGTQDVMNGKFRAVYFQQKLGTLPVERGYMTVLVKNEPGFPAVLASANVQPVAMTSLTPSISADAAKKVVLRTDRSLAAITAPQLVAYQGETETLLTWKFIVDNLNLENHKKYTVYVDAHTGSVVEWKNEIYNVDVHGHVDAFASPGLKPDNFTNPSQQMALAGLRVAISGGGNSFTNSLGDFTIPNGGSSAVTVQTDMRGQWVRVVPSQGSALTSSQNVTPPGPANFLLNGTPQEFNTSQVNAFIHTEIVHNFAKGINPSYPGIDIQLPANVNINNQCNATFSGNAINFYASESANGCPNTAYSTVVYHEYGHFIIDRGHPSPTGDYHEGMADVTASMLTNNPGLGQDFHGPNTGFLRNANNNVNHPCTGGSHTCGQVISGAFWNTLQQMKAAVGEATALQLVRSWYLNSILLHPPDIDPGITIDVLTLDDDNGNIFDGTPHYEQINAGFSAKNLPAPALQWVEFTPDWLVQGIALVRATNSTITSSFIVENGAGVVDPNSVKVHFKINTGAWQQADAIQRGGFHLARFTASHGQTVSWYMSAKDTQGRTSFYPAAGANTPLRVTLGTGTQQVFSDTFETNLGWTVSNTSVTSGAWTRANPNGTSQVLGGVNYQANPENDSGDAGALCFFTGQGSAGGQVGSADVDGGPTRLTSPLIDMSSGNHVIDLSRWFYNDDGDDSMSIEISNNNGSTWTVVDSTMFSGTENTWTPIQIPVAAFVTPTSQMRIRVSTSDNPNNSITEAAIDNVVIRRILQ